jgi:hypothetical protein
MPTVTAKFGIAWRLPSVPNTALTTFCSCGDFDDSRGKRFEIFIAHEFPVVQRFIQGEMVVDADAAEEKVNAADCFDGTGELRRFSRVGNMHLVQIQMTLGKNPRVEVLPQEAFKAQRMLFRKIVAVVTHAFVHVENVQAREGEPLAITTLREQPILAGGADRHDKARWPVSRVVLANDFDHGFGEVFGDSLLVLHNLETNVLVSSFY